ncbi:MAG: DHH family phosphoesterase [Candidatus Pacearchaeota archaeon]
MENKIEYLIGKEQDFYDFLDGITKKDKVAIISHIDLDGISSALFLQEILKSKGIKTKVLEFTEVGSGAFSKLPKKFKKKKITKIFMSDINEESDYENFEKLKNEFEVFLIDHHPSENKTKDNVLKTKSEHCAAWIIYNLGSKITNLEKLKTLVCATMITEFSYNNENNFNFLKQNFPDLTKDNLMDSEPGNLSETINAGITYFKGDERKIFDLVLKGKTKKLEKYHKIIQKEIQNLIDEFHKKAEFYSEKNLYFYYASPKFSLTSAVATILSLEFPDKTIIIASDVKNEKDFVKVSSRNQSGNVNLNELMKKGIVGLENASAGGHIMASAAKFMKKDLEKFKQNILA